MAVATAHSWTSRLLDATDLWLSGRFRRLSHPSPTDVTDDALAQLATIGLLGPSAKEATEECAGNIHRETQGTAQLADIRRLEEQD